MKDITFLIGPGNSQVQWGGEHFLSGFMCRAQELWVILGPIHMLWVYLFFFMIFDTFFPVVYLVCLSSNLLSLKSWGKVVDFKCSR